MIAVAGLATALLAGCAAGLAGEPPAPAGQRVQQVLRAWSAFPATASPRPLVHGGGTVACSAVGYLRQVKVVLPAPLGGRVLVDAANGAAIPVFGAPASAG
jgi:hypothetical protein